MIKDRGIKWTAMMLPDHVYLLEEARFDEERIQKPVLDEHEIDELEIRILEAMETNSPLVFNIFNNGFTQTIKGTTHYVNHLKSQFIVQDDKGYFHHVGFKNLLSANQE